MAGSLSHIIAEDGSFTMNLIENMGDAHEALEECHQIIAALIDRSGDGLALARACRRVNAPVPSVTPKLA